MSAPDKINTIYYEHIIFVQTGAAHLQSTATEVMLGFVGSGDNPEIVLNCI